MCATIFGLATCLICNELLTQPNRSFRARPPNDKIPFLAFPLLRWSIQHGPTGLLNGCNLPTVLMTKLCRNDRIEGGVPCLLNHKTLGSPKYHLSIHHGSGSHAHFFIFYLAFLHSPSTSHFRSRCLVFQDDLQCL
jgi:hypothetical protein